MARSRAADLLALVPAAAIPLLFLHARYQPAVVVGPLTVYLSDVAVGLTVLAAVVAGVLAGWEPLVRTRRLWLIAAGLLVLCVVSCFWRPFDETQKHLVTAAKFVEYPFLAPALVLLLRRRVQVERLLAVAVLWSLVASAWGSLQFLGLVNEFNGRRPGQLEPSFIGNIDFAAVSGASLATAFALLAAGRRSRLIPAALLAGAVGAILAAQVLPFSGMVVMAALCLMAGRRTRTLDLRRAATIVATTFVVAVGVLALRSYDTANFLRFLGIRPASSTASTQVQTGSQRTMLGYIGLRIWIDHPLLGVGFERSADRYQPYLAAAKRRFPQAEDAYPSKQHPWGVQNLWIQLLADMGVLGLVLGGAVFVTGFLFALRAPSGTRVLGLVAASWLVVAIGTWNAVGIVAGIPLDAVTWIGLGLAAVARMGLVEA